MNRLKILFQSFCITTTAALFGMILSLEIINRQVTVRLIDLWGLMLAAFLIMFWYEVVYHYLEGIHIGNWTRNILHYIGTSFILIEIGRKLEWLGLQENKNVIVFWGIITFIYIIACKLITCYNNKLSKDINEALERYREDKEKE